MKLPKILIAIFSMMIITSNYVFSQNSIGASKESLKQTIFNKWEALKNGNMDSIKKYMHEDFIAIRANTGHHNKQNSIFNNFQDKSIQIINVEPIGDLMIEIYENNLGVVYGKIKLTDIVNGKKSTEKLNFFDVFIYKDGVWKDIFWNSSTLK
ncbi:MAG: nuclear transport factor 2 family protein [Alphaproteobacteria bacterium]|nr:nuclear transport factor 2 family protein [Alphaproteobacteria bacterium]